MFRGRSFQTTIGGIVCLIGGAYLLFTMVFMNANVDEIHIALLAFCFGSGWIGVKAKDSNVHTDMLTGENITVKK